MTDPEEQEMRDAFSRIAVEKFRGVGELLTRAMSIIEGGDVRGGLQALAHVHTMMQGHSVMYAVCAHDLGFITVDEGTALIEAGKVDAQVSLVDFDNIAPADFL